MTDSSTPAASAGPPPTADPQDPLPESSWKWRRIFVFLSTATTSVGILIIMLMLYQIAKVDLSGRQGVQTTLATIESLYNLAFWLIILTLVDRVLYLIAPSAEQATKMLATVSALKSGVAFTSTSRATSSEGEAVSTSAAGPSTAALVAPEPPLQPSEQPEQDYAP